MKRNVDILARMVERVFDTTSLHVQNANFQKYSRISLEAAETVGR
jgi:hypothetical protein